jgi:FMN hydrolase / 5-amino-6-(5-phospho-D-ribitylamino)uracil phosphatase
MKALGFDFGQTLAELDYDFLQRRLRERAASFDPQTAAANSKQAWLIYGAKKSDGHAEAWRAMMEAQLTGGGVAAEPARELSAWLWQEQPRQNLWRRPIAGMIELVRELKRVGTPIAIISNSEGHLAELIAELGWAPDFDVVVDSGRLGIDKPDPRIFTHACGALGIANAELLHVGDAWEADVMGALGASASAVWFDREHRERALPARVYGAASAAELREVLARLGFLS